MTPGGSKFSAPYDTRKSAALEPASASPASSKALHAENTFWRSLALQPVVLQTKLRVGSSSDAAEQAADHVANAAVADEHAPEGITAHANLPATTAPPAVHEALHSPSQPLDTDTRTFMESRLGSDFSGVRVHTGSLAARANDTLQSRAFTSGRSIAFATGQYSPGIPAGRHLIAHELAHVRQQSRAGGTVANTVQRAPALSGHKTTELIDDSIAGDVDEALAASATLKKYIDPKALRKIKGHVSVDAPEVFEYRYTKYAKAHSGMSDVKNVPGYNDRTKNMIELKQRSADLEAIIHEAVHFNSQEAFAKSFGHKLNEGVTEYFTEAILSEQKLGSGRAYRSELKLATAFVSSVGEDAAGKAYFAGDRGAHTTVITALGKAGTFSAWFQLMASKKPADWDEAAKLLRAAMGQ